jgi:ABC-type tungstate transport system permease subunit
VQTGELVDSETLGNVHDTKLKYLILEQITQEVTSTTIRMMTTHPPTVNHIICTVLYTVFSSAVLSVNVLVEGTGDDVIFCVCGDVDVVIFEHRHG